MQAYRPRAWTCAIAIAAAACGGEAADDRATPRPGPPASDRVSIAPPPLAPEVRAHVDSGNVAFERGDVAAALGHFEAALAADTASGAAWFGAWMAHMELGDTERAAEARSRLGEVARPRPGDPHSDPRVDPRASSDPGSRNPSRQEEGA